MGCPRLKREQGKQGYDTFPTLPGCNLHLNNFRGGLVSDIRQLCNNQYYGNYYRHWLVKSTFTYQSNSPLCTIRPIQLGCQKSNLTITIHGPGQFRGHDLHDEAHPQTKHLGEEVRLGAYEERQVNQELLCDR